MFTPGDKTALQGEITSRPTVDASGERFVTATIDDVTAVEPRADSEPVLRADPGLRRSLLVSGWSKGGGLLVAVVVLACAVVASLALGAKSIPFSDVLGAVFGFDPDEYNHQIVRDMRLPRTILGLIVGSALAMAGAAMQGVTRNPLADTGIFGINGGASLAVVVATPCGRGRSSRCPWPWP